MIRRAVPTIALSVGLLIAMRTEMLGAINLYQPLLRRTHQKLPPTLERSYRKTEFGSSCEMKPTILGITQTSDGQLGAGSGKIAALTVNNAT
jgi:hypothetical protein